jgi:mRNA-degrading endonuclease toxin of MazEF toxin-antitoxin module
VTAAEGIKRGGIYLVDLNTDPAGEPKKRPLLVVQNDQGNQAGATTIVVSLTSVTPSQTYPFHVHLPADVLGRPGVILCEQVKTVGLDRVDPYRLAECSPDLMRQVDEALRLSLGL